MSEHYLLCFGIKHIEPELEVERAYPFLWLEQMGSSIILACYCPSKISCFHLSLGIRQLWGLERTVIGREE